MLLIHTIVAACLAITIVISFLSRAKSVLDFYLAGRGLGTYVIALTYFATYFSAASFVGGGVFSFLFGMQWFSGSYFFT